MKSINALLRTKLKRAEPQTFVVIGIIIILTVVMSIIIPGFTSAYNFKIMVENFIPEGIMALGMTLVIISGGIDLSIAGTMPFTAIIFCLLMKSGIHFGIAMIIILCMGAAIGLINNELRNILDVHPFIVTMAMMLTLKGINLVITGDGPVSGMPENFIKFASIKPLGIQWSLWIFVVLALCWWTLLRKNRYFRQVYFVGGNPKTAELSGIKTKNVLRFVYVQSSVLAAVAGIVAVLTYQAANYSYGLNVEVRVITAVVVGGTSMTHGGIGTIGGTTLGLLFVALIYDAFLMSGISTYYQDMATGLLFIIAVLFSEQIKNIKKVGG
jgi:ribose/xylose/arabinose/galactoside ABC-type transport system permease subunit